MPTIIVRFYIAAMEHYDQSHLGKKGLFHCILSDDSPSLKEVKARI